jgi:diguanylate cyclase (GGDEF)-like protein/PAS domain S-box-containing protein
MNMLIEIRNKPLVMRIGLLLAVTSICALLLRLSPSLTEYALFGTSILPAIILGWSFGWQIGLGSSPFLFLAAYLVSLRGGALGGAFQFDEVIYAGLLYAGSSVLFVWLYDLFSVSHKQAQKLRDQQDFLQAERHERRQTEKDLEVMNNELITLNQQLEELNADLETRVTTRTAELEESQSRYSLAVRGTHAGIWDWNLSTGKAYFSPRWYEILGLEEKDSQTDLSLWLDCVHEEDTSRVRKDLGLHIEGVTPHLESEHRILHQDGSCRWVLVRGMARQDNQGKTIYMAGSLSDITQRKTLEEQLERDALYDPLTGLPNRALFMDRLRQTLERIKRRPDGQFAILVIDLDHFRLVNDSYGHAYGDKLLIAITTRLQNRLRTEDTLARLGGDELALLVEDGASGSEAIKVAKRILEEFVEPFIINGRTIYSDASIGIKLALAEPPDVEELIRDASTAMCLAKAAGRGRFEIYNRKMHTATVERIQLQTDLRQAVDRREFKVAYQPLIRLDTGIISGFEALVRWQHPERGLLEPSKFISLAEEVDLIEHIDLFVLREACLQGVVWHKEFASEPPLSISVNFSGNHFSRTSLVGKIERVLEETGFSPESLVLEVTESSLMANADTANEVIARLQARGISFHMDDFGTGYSSLSYLQRFPFHTLKIDRSFIRDLSEHPENKEIVQAIIALANNLGMQVIAEGIENAADLLSVQNLTCGHGQGFLFSKPVSSQEANELIAGKKSYIQLA